MEITQKEFNRRFKRLPKNIQRRLILRCGLRRRHEKVLLLSYIEELDYMAIGERLGMTSESVGNMLVDARKELKEKLKYYEDELKGLL